MTTYTKTAITNLAGVNRNAGYALLEEQTRIHQLFISTLNTARKRKKKRIMHLYLVHPFCLSADEDMTIRFPRGLPQRVLHSAAEDAGSGSDKVQPDSEHEQYLLWFHKQISNIMGIAVLKLRKKSISDIVEKVRNVVTRMTGNLFFATPHPTLVVVTADVDILDTLEQETLQGGKVKNTLKKIAKQKLLATMAALTGYVQTTSLGDEDQILSAGYELKRKPVKLGMLYPPSNFRAAFGLHPGEIILRWAGVYGRLEYFVQVSTDPTNPALWTNVPNGHTGKVRLVVSGLTPGQVYYFRIFTECVAGTSGPGEIANHMAA